MNKTDTNRGGDRYYNRATFLAIAALAIFAIFYSIDFFLEGLTSKIWVVLSGCAACGFVIFLFRRARGILNPAFSVPFLIHVF